MRRLDLYLQRRRIEAAMPWIRPGSRVLDVGCADGALFGSAGALIGAGVGIDVDGSYPWSYAGVERRVGGFPDVVASNEQFDAVVMLAVIEHLPPAELGRWAVAVPRVLDAGGRLIITTPSPRVDRLLAIGRKVRLLDGMETEQHYGFEPREVPRLFADSGLTLEHHRRFELGLNHLFVFGAAA